MDIARPAILVDICGTLFDSNTTFDFLDYSIVKRSYKFYRHLRKTFFWRLLNKSLHTLGYDLSRTIAIRFLKGKSRKELDVLMDTFYAKKLSMLKHHAVWEKVDALRSNGDELILVSATLDFIAAKIAAINGFNTVFATTLSFDNEVCNGVICSDLLGKKGAFLEKENIYAPYKMVITDNLSDLNLIEASNDAIIVCTPRNQKIWNSALQKIDYRNYEFILV